MSEERETGDIVGATDALRDSLVLSGERLGLETDRDLVREIKHAHPELRREWKDL